MKQTRKIMAVGGDLTGARDWAELGRRILEAADEAARIRIRPASNVRGRPSPMRHPNTEEVDRS
jgi:hypothetical protein